MVVCPDGAGEDQQRFAGLNCQHQCLPEHRNTNIIGGICPKGEVIYQNQNSNNKTCSLIPREPKMDQYDVKWPNDVF
jgi:hypothetical protein